MTGKPFHTVREGVSCLENANRSFGIEPLPERASLIAGTDGGLCPSAWAPSLDPRVAWAKVGSLVAGERLAPRVLAEDA